MPDKRCVFQQTLDRNRRDHVACVRIFRIISLTVREPCLLPHAGTRVGTAGSDSALPMEVAWSGRPPPFLIFVQLAGWQDAIPDCTP